MLFNLGLIIIQMIPILHSLHQLHNSCNNKTRKSRHLRNTNNRIRNNYNKTRLKKKELKIRASFQIKILIQQSLWRRMKRSKIRRQCSQLLSLTNLHLLFLQTKLLRIMTTTIQMVRFAPISSNWRTFWLLRCAKELLQLVINLKIWMIGQWNSSKKLRTISLIWVQVNAWPLMATRPNKVLSSIALSSRMTH